MAHLSAYRSLWEYVHTRRVGIVHLAGAFYCLLRGQREFCIALTLRNVPWESLQHFAHGVSCLFLICKDIAR